MCTSNAYGHVDDHVEDNDTIHSSDPSLEADVSATLPTWPTVPHDEGVVSDS